MFEKGALCAHYARPIEFKTCNIPRERRADWHDRAAAVLEELYHPIAHIVSVSNSNTNVCVFSGTSFLSTAALWDLYEC